MPKLARLPAIERTADTAGADVSRIPRLQRYYAFLSYSHRDKELADWLHRELEKFRIPHSLAGRLTANGVVPKRLTPVFRDEQELAAAHDLGEEIRAALASSQFLIVLCSPSAANSRWTNAEIEAFKRTRPEGCVLAAIADGEPFASETPGREADECFPPALRHRYDRRGRPTLKRAEPLAADLRDGGEARRIGFLKLVAGMIGVGLDELVQREAKRRHRRLAWVAGASLAGMAVTSTLAIAAIEARDSARDQRREAEGLVGFMLGDLKDKLEPIGRLDALDAVGSRALAYYQHQDKGSLTDDALAQRAKALTLMGEIANTRGDLDGALSRYQEALASTGEALRRHPDDPQRLFDHAQNVYWVGYIAYQRGRLDDAAARFREYERLADGMVALAPDKKDYRVEQIYANDSLGAVLWDQHRFREAASTYRTTLGIAEALAAAEPRNVDYQKRVENILAWLADASEGAGNLDQALGYRERQVRLLTELTRADPRDTELQRDALTAHRGVGRLLASRGDSAAGMKEALTAVAIGDSLFRIEPENTEWLQANALARFDLADLQLAAGLVDEAASTVRSACDIAGRLAERNSTVSDWAATKQVLCLTFKGRIALRQGAPGEAFAMAQQALTAARLSPKPIERRILTMRSMSMGSLALAALGRAEQSRAVAQAASRLVPAADHLNPRDTGDLAALQLRAGNRDAARGLIERLSAIGYRHPTYVNQIRLEGGKT